MRSWAPKLIELGWTYEADKREHTQFSCLLVRSSIGEAAEAAYAAVFNLDETKVEEPLYLTPELRELWETMTDQERREQRCMMLYFAAAMAETGDL